MSLISMIWIALLLSLWQHANTNLVGFRGLVFLLLGVGLEEIGIYPGCIPWGMPCLVLSSLDTFVCQG